MNSNFIKTQDPETITKLKRLGLVVLLQEDNGMVTFLNDQQTIKKFESGLKFTFSNTINI